MFAFGVPVRTVMRMAIIENFLLGIGATIAGVGLGWVLLRLIISIRMPEMMPDIDIVLVSPLYEGNIGFSARVMKNFGFSRLVLVDPCPIGDEALMRASHARDVLSSAEVISFDEVVARSDLVVATTGEVNKSVCRSMRMPYHSPRELRELIDGIKGRVSILLRPGELGPEQR